MNEEGRKEGRKEGEGEGEGEGEEEEEEGRKIFLSRRKIRYLYCTCIILYCTVVWLVGW